MPETPALIDRAALTRNRARANPDALPFLHALAADELQDRLQMVNRSFSAPAVVTPFPGLWRARWPDAHVIPDDEVLALDEGRHDLILHAMALHWANDPVGQLIQMRRALKPDGLMLAAMLGGQTLHELRASLAQAESELSGGLSPRVAPMAEIRDLGALMQRAGLSLPVADSVPLSASYQNALHLMRDLRAMGETNALSQRRRHPMRRAVLLRAVELYQAHFGVEDGRVRATYDMIVLTGWAPGPDQPQPLRPGSAKTRLADALGTTETPIGD